MDNSLILAIDQGGQSSRVAVYRINGEQLFCFSEPCETTHCVIDDAVHIEQNPHDILMGIQHCFTQVCVALGDDVQHIVAAGFAGQGSSLLCWDNQTGEALSPVLSWQDVRGDDYLQHILLAHSSAQALTGLRVSPHYGASKMRWCLDNNPQVIQAQRHGRLSIGPIVSYLFWHLLGVSSVDPGHAQRTLLWNIERNDWDNSLLALFNIPKSIFPECKSHNSFFGTLILQHHHIPFVASGRDQGASLFANGIPEQTACFVNVGTGAFVQRVCNNFNVPDGLLVSPLWLSKNATEKKYYCWEATVNGAASAISFLQQETGLLISPENIAQALTLTPTKEVFFLNAIGGFSAPYWRTDLQSIFSKNLLPEEKILAWIESIIFQLVINVNAMNQQKDIQKIVISGGISKADGICQRLADLLGISVHRSENTDATLQGVAYMATGLSPAWEPARNEEIFLPEINAALLKRFETWRNSMHAWLR